MRKHYHCKNGWRSRGYIPHFDSPHVFQFVTFRLADSLPSALIAKINKQAEMLPQNKKFLQIYNLTEKVIDKSYGSCFLKMPEIAALVRNSIIHLSHNEYQLASYCIMPNHVHLLIKINEGRFLDQVLGKLKSFTALRINQELSRSGPFWAREYFDRYIRNKDHFESVRHYILNNPVKAGLVKNQSDWKHSWAESLDKSYK